MNTYPNGGPDRQPVQAQPPQFQPYQPGLPPRAMLPPPQYPRPQRSFCWRDVFTVLGFVSSVVGYFFASVLLLPLVFIASIVLMKVMLILSEAALLPDWFTNGIW